MGDEHLSTTPEIESDEIIKSSVENLVPIPSEYEGIFDDTCDVPICEDSSTFDALKDHYEILSDSNDDDTSSDDDAFENIEYVEASLPDSELVSLEEVNDVYQKEKEIVLEDIFQIQDVILHEKLLNINRLIANIKSLNGNPSPDRVLNTITHADISVPKYDRFTFDIKPDSGELISAVMNNIDELNEGECFNPGGGEIDVFANVEDDDYFPFIFVIRIFLPYLIYLEVSPLLLSTGSEDTIFDPGIST
nr:hypothetical protein [Tanacetum cinerariifolium]